MSIEEDKQQILESGEDSRSSKIFDKTKPDIELMQLAGVLLQHKKKFIAIVMVFALSSVGYALWLPKFYKATILMVPAEQSSQISSSLSGLLGAFTGSSGQSSSVGAKTTSPEVALSILTSRSFIEMYITENNLMPIIFAHRWNKEKNDWMNVTPRLFDGYLSVLGSMDINSDQNIFTITVTGASPEYCATFMNNIIRRLNEYIRNESIDEGNRAIAFLENELEETKLANSKTMLFRLIEQQTQNNMIANVREEYAFKVIDPAIEPVDHAGPNRRFIVFIGTLLGTFVGTISILIVHFIQLNRRKRITT